MNWDWMRCKTTARLSLCILTLIVFLGGSVHLVSAETPLALRWMTGKYEGHPTISPYRIPLHEQDSMNITEFQDDTLSPNGWEKAPGYYEYRDEGIVLYKRWNDAFNAEEELWLSYWRHADNRPAGSISGWTLLYVTADGASATQTLYHKIADEIQNMGQQNGYWKTFNGQPGLGEYGAYYTFNKVNINGYDEDMEFCPGDGGVILSPRQWKAYVVQGPDGHGAFLQLVTNAGPSPYDRSSVIYHSEDDPLLQ